MFFAVIFYFFENVAIFTKGVPLFTVANILCMSLNFTAFITVP
jgi:hypothetical protein